MQDILGLLANNTAALVISTGVLGLVVGSFLNVVILRLPQMMEREWRQQCAEFQTAESQSDTTTTAPHVPEPVPVERFDLVSPRSRCPKCQHAIAGYDNVPVVSYLLLRGRCRHCGNPISARYPAIELFTAVLSAVVAWKFGFTAATAAALVLTWSLVALTFIDIDHQLLPDSVTLPLIWIGLLLSLTGMFIDPRSSIIGAVAGYLSLWTVYQVFKLVTGKEGMGFGDFKLFAAFGAWMGWQALPLIILLSSAVGAVIGISLIVLRGRDRNIPIPFGPYLAAAGWIYLLWGDTLMARYLGATSGAF